MWNQFFKPALIGFSFIALLITVLLFFSQFSLLWFVLYACFLTGIVILCWATGGFFLMMREKYGKNCSNK